MKDRKRRRQKRQRKHRSNPKDRNSKNETLRLRSLRLRSGQAGQARNSPLAQDYQASLLNLTGKRRFTKHGRRIVPRGKDTDKLHRRYRVMRLPAKVQAVIFRGYADGKPYDEICANVEKMGYHLTRNAVGNYWRDIWKKEHVELQKAQTLLVVLKQALGLPRNSPSRKVAEELLYTLVFLAFPLLKKEGPLALLREAREQRKVEGKSQRQPTERKSLKQHLEQLYGPGVVVEEEIEGSDPEDEAG